ncbi:MAG TPA: Asp23/Gls24 family envelope stress response protein [Candidatus Faeciplasma avium]|uniref:Asp23/Gls24 family envelope stress response protein n=1 Tax=Candidatus Faeciplasma avium TaxID=2840798 RepID=A0A9D1NRY9_9FIRM|nr:Asp23/Gls24 family envelope stress response protein [Candidatus Faeciplasma avium]
MDIEKAKKGTLRVSQNVIITITKNAALEVEGVSRIAVRSLDIMKLFSSKLDNSLINIEMLDGVAKISLSIVVLSGYNVMSVCEQIQEKVKSAVQSMTGVTVSKVNVSVVDVDFPAGSAEENS